MIGFGIVGCSRESFPNKNSQAPSVTQPNSVEEKIRIVKDSAEIGPGPLTKENVSLGGIHIGDSQEQVLKLYGEPTKKEHMHSTGFLGWYYDDLGLLVQFYTKGGLETAEGVVQIDIYSPSKLTTDTGIGIGYSLDSILKKYDEVYSSKVRDNNRTIFLTGANKYEFEIHGSKEKVTIYYPELSYFLENNKINRIILSNQQQRP